MNWEDAVKKSKSGWAIRYNHAGKEMLINKDADCRVLSMSGPVFRKAEDKEWKGRIDWKPQLTGLFQEDGGSM